MNAFELPAGVQHGTPEGFEAGCRKERHCPALLTHGMCCLYAHIRAASDFRYYRAKARNPDPASIARALGIRPPAPKEAEKEAATDDAFAGRHPKYRFRPRGRKGTRPELVDVVDEPDPAPAPDPAPVPDPTPEPSPEPEETPMAPAPAPLTTDKWTSGLTARDKAAVLHSIRVWARQNGFPGVPDRGRIPQDALAAYDAAHPAGTPINVTAPAPKKAPGKAAKKPAQPLAERAQDTAPQEDAGEPAIEEETLGDVPAVEVEAMGHPTTAEPLSPQEFAGALEQTRILAGLQADAYAHLGDTGPEENDTGSIPEKRPEWAEVAISVDVAHAERERDSARRWAVHLEQELAETVRRLQETQAQLEAALAAVALTLQKWAAEQAEKDRALRALRDATALYAADGALRDVVIGFNEATIAQLRFQLAAEQQKRSPWFKRVAS